MAGFGALLPYVPSAIQTGVSLGRYMVGRRKRPKRWDETAYSKFLKRAMEEGIYTPKAERTILGKVGRETGQAAQREKVTIRGLLESGGIGSRSIAGIRTMAKPERESLRKIGDIAKEIAIENELSKRGFEEKYALGKTEEERGRLLEERRSLGELISGVGQAGGLAYRGYRLGELLEMGEKDPELKAYGLAGEAGVKPPYGGFRLGGEKSFEEKLKEMEVVLKMLGLL